MFIFLVITPMFKELHEHYGLKFTIVMNNLVFKTNSLSLSGWWLPVFTKMDKPARCWNLLPWHIPATCTGRKVAFTQKSSDWRKSTSSKWFPELPAVFTKESRCPNTSVHWEFNHDNTDTKQKPLPLWWCWWYRLFSGRISFQLILTLWYRVHLQWLTFTALIIEETQT